MAVQLTGSPSYVTNTTHGDGSQAVTIPSDCDCVLVFSWAWVSNTAVDFDELNWDNGATLDFTLVATNTSANNPYDVWCYRMCINDGNWPGTGSKTLYWSYNSAPSEGGTVVIVFLKGVNTSSPVIDTDSTKNPAGTSWTASLSGVSTGDLTFICGADYYSYSPDINCAPSGYGQTLLTSGANDHLVDWSIGYEDGEGAPRAEYSSSSVYEGIIAFAIAAAAAGATLPDILKPKINQPKQFLPILGGV